jgi:hypothetical protein
LALSQRCASKPREGLDTLAEKHTACLGSKDFGKMYYWDLSQGLIRWVVANISISPRVLKAWFLVQQHQDPWELVGTE